MSRRGLKCPRCKGHNAWLEWGFNERLGRRYRQKHCGCGYSGTRQYRGQIMTLEEYRQAQELLHREITERLGKL